MGNKSIQLIDNTKGTWIVAKTNMFEMYNILNDFLTGERRAEDCYIPRNKVNHLISWLPNIESIVIEEKNENMFMEIRFDGHDFVFDDSGLESYFIEMIEDGDFTERMEKHEN